MSKTNFISRRNLIKQAGSAAALSFCATATPQLARAAADMKNTQAPGFYRTKLGEFEITILSDGSYSFPTNLMGTNQPREKVQKYLKDHHLDPDNRTSHVNIPLINTGKELVLVDVGGGQNFLAGAGKLIENMEASGYAPDDVDKIILTHGHPDHIWGLIDDFDELIFPNATYYMSQGEWDFWTSDKAKTTLPEMFQSMAAGASRRLPMIADNTKRLKPGEEIASGIVTMATPGHTPGHMSVQVTSGSHSLIITADTLTHPFVSFEQPDWWSQTDLDAKTAETSRRKTLSEAAAERTQLLVYHLSFPGLGYVAPMGSAYRWIPATWQWQL